MEKRCINQLFIVFDLINYDLFRISEKGPFRVFFEYDRKKKVKRFTLLQKGISKEENDTIEAWLEGHVFLEDVLWGMPENRLDVGRLQMRSFSSPLEER
jgi:hypothetical protein